MKLKFPGKSGPMMGAVSSKAHVNIYYGTVNFGQSAESLFPSLLPGNSPRDFQPLINSIKNEIVSYRPFFCLYVCDLAGDYLPSKKPGQEAENDNRPVLCGMSASRPVD